MQNYIGYSGLPDVSAAIDEAASGLEAGAAKLVLFTTDTARFEDFTVRLHERFPSASVLGGTSYAAMNSIGCERQALSLFVLYGDMVCQAGILQEISRYPMKNKPVVDRCLEGMRSRENLVCFEMMTAFSNAEELVLDTLRTALGEDVPLFGGSAGSEFEDTGTLVSLDGIVYAEGCVFALVSSPRRVRLFLENIYKTTGHCFTATDVDCERRTVYEFDHTPAAQVIANALGTEVDGLAALLPRHPLGRVIGGQIYLVEGLSVGEDDEMAFFARIYTSTRMELMELDDFRRVSGETRCAILSEVPRPAFALVVNCLSRSKLFENTDFINGFFCGGVFPAPFFGISGYGEQLGGKHLNASMVVAVFE